MEWLTNLYLGYPLLVWLAIAAIFLAIEVATGSGWLLWPAGAAAVVAFLTFLLPDSLMLELGLFAAVTAVSALLGRRFLPSEIGSGPDINDNIGRLVGQQGRTVEGGRVFIDGKEWAAAADDGSELPPGQPVQVIGTDGSVLRVRPLP